MKRLFKLLLWLVGGLVSLLVVAVVVVPLVFDPNDHKQFIASQVAKYTGLPVRIEGDIGLTVFPWLGVTLGVVELGQAPGFEGDVFARTGSMQVRVKLLPLLEKKIEMDTVTIGGLELNLARNADGRGNWEVVTEAAAAATDKPDAADDPGAPAVAVLAIGGLDVSDAAVSWRDALAGQQYKVSDMTLTTGALDPTRPVPVSLAFDVAGGAPAVAGHVTLEASVTIEPGAQVLIARNLKLGGDLSKAGPLGEALKLALSGDLALNGDTQALKLDGLSLDLDAGLLTAIGGPAKITLRGNLAASGPSRQVSLSAMDLAADLAGKEIPGGKARVTAKGDLSADLLTQRVTIAGLQGDVADLAMLGAAAGASLSGEFDGNLETQVYDLAGARFSGSFTGYPDADSHLAFDGAAGVRVDAAAKQVALADLALDLPGLKMPGVAGDLRIATSLAGDYGAARYVAKQFALEGKLAGPAVKGDLDVKLTAAVEADLGKDTVQLTGLKLSGKQAGFAGAGSQAGFNGGANLRLAPRAQTVAASDIALDVTSFSMTDLGGRARLGGALSADIAKGRYTSKKVELDGALAGALVGGELDFKLTSGVDATLDSGAVALPGFRIDGNIAGADIPGGKLPFKVAADVNGNLTTDRLDIGALNATAGPLKASGELGVTALRSAPSYSGRLALASFNARKLLELLGQPVPDTADKKALTDVSLEASIVGSGDEISLNPLRLGLDGTRASGRVQMIGFSKPAWRFDVDVDQIDADRYLPPAKPGGGAAATPGAAAGAAAGLPVETLRALDAQGELRIGQLKLSNLRLSSIVVRLEGNDGLVRLSPLGARLYEGSYDGNVAIDARGQQPQLSVNERLTGVQIGSLLRDLKNLDTLSGRTDVQLRATATGGTADAIKRTLNGDANFQLTDGAFRGIDVTSTLCGLVSGGLQALGSAGFQSGEGGSTKFSDLTGTATVTNGVVVNPDLQVRSPLLRITGAGQANLVTEQLDYTATANLVGSCQGQGGLAISELASIAVPVRVSGSFARPNYGIDPAALIQALGKTKLKDVLQKSLGIPVPESGTATGTGAATAPTNPLQDVLQKSLGLPTAPAPAQPAPAEPATADTSRGLPPAGGSTQQQQEQQQQQSQQADPKKQAIEGLIKGLFGN